MGPDLIELLRNPNLACDVPDEAIPALLCQLAALQSVLASRLLTIPAQSSPCKVAPENDRLLTAEEAASLLNVTPKWLSRRASKLPFTRHLSRKALRFSEAGLRQWLAARQGRTF